jgi:molybdate transport system substrate-binding protein
MVSAAISLREAFVEIGQNFRHAHPKDKVLFNFGASGALAQQIKQGAPVDVFASASSKEIDLLRKQHLLIDQSIKPIAMNKLVVIVPRGSKPITMLNQLDQFKQITIGDPASVPAGKYAAEALGQDNLYHRLADQHKLVFAESVRQALAYVESANVDAGIVFNTDARKSDKVTLCFTVSTAATEPIVYAAAVLSDTKRKQLARNFVDYLTNPAATAVLQSKGFLAVTK